MALRATEMHEEAARDSTKPVVPAILSPVFFSRPNLVFRRAEATRISPGARKRPVSPRREQSAGWTAVDAEVLARHACLFQAKARSLVDSWHDMIGVRRRFCAPDH